MAKGLWGFPIAMLLTLGSATSFAQPTKDADAERLFREGQSLMADHRYGEACPKFEAAYRKDQQLGTLLNLAYCHKEQGAIWQSWLEFREAELKAAGLKRTDRKEFAKKSMTELEKTLVKVVVDVPSKVELSEVVVEDRTIPEGEKGVVFAAEPGTRKFVFRAKGKKDAIQMVTLVKQGDKPHHVTVPEMVDDVAPKEPVAPPPPASDPDATPSTPAPSTDAVKDGSPQKTAGLVVMGVGAVALGVGAIFGLKTIAWNDCADGDTLTPCTQAKRDAVSADGTLATMLMVPGGVVVVGGFLLWLTAPNGSQAATVGTRSRARSSSSASSRAVRVRPEIGAGWAGLSGSF